MYCRIALQKYFVLSIKSVFLMSNLSTSRFVLTGFPGLEVYYFFFAIPFSTIYAMVFLGNCMILHVIRTESSLHQPMFYFLAMLALTDLCMGLSTVHTVLGILWGFLQEISLDACIAQSYFIHGLSIMESSLPCPLIATLPFATLYAIPPS